ncbi:hypothetical protein [Halorubellus litoreus]|uniref:Uncharacterized protein n=1 Tax=Halorubellus litoreus TaxID=755308 RepID=A0ABD5VH32_9EURY
MQQPTVSERDHEGLDAFWEKVDLVVYLALIAVVTPAATKMVSAAWQSGGLSRTLVVTLEELVGVSHLEFVLFWLGAYAGLVALLLFDDIKRVQGVLLVVASAIAFVGFRSNGLLTSLQPVENAPVLAAGFALSFVLAGGRRLRNGKPPYEFRAATAALFWVVATIVTVGFLERHLSYTTPVSFADGRLQTAAAVTNVTFVGADLFTDFVAASVLVIGAHLFTSYRAQRDVFVLGVQRAGKTMLAAALYKAAEQESPNTRLNPSEPLTSLSSSIHGDDDAVDGFGDDDYTGPTEKGETHLHRFRSLDGALFKEYVNVDVLDYAGEYVGAKLVEYVKAFAPSRKLSLAWVVYVYESVRGLPSIPEKAEGLDSAEIQRLMAKQIVHSDTLCVIVDAGSLVPEVPYGDEDYRMQDDLSSYLETYVQILRHVDESLLEEKEVVLVVTKSDYLYQLYRTVDTRLDFFQWVNYYLLESPEGREKLGPLVNQAQVDRVHPVYYDLDHDASLEAGEPVPDRPITVNGARSLLRRIKGGA